MIRHVIRRHLFAKLRARVNTLRSTPQWDGTPVHFEVRIIEVLVYHW
jgi:hypothetical protein